MKIGIFGSLYSVGKYNSFQTLSNYLSEQEVEMVMERDLPPGEPFPLDMAISVGGDGTFLRTAAWVGRQGIPILGINTGRLGFLADVPPSEITETMGEILQGRYRLEERSLLQLRAPGNLHDPSPYALNEMAFLKRDTSSMISIAVSIDGAFLTEYLADGLLVATPTGSTAYNLSVNGPILVPQSRNFVLSPVAPHTLNVRPLVIPDNVKLSLQVESRSRNFLVSLDGRSEVFPSGSEFEVEKADFGLKIVKRLDQSFYETLRNKLLWGAARRR